MPPGERGLEVHAAVGDRVEVVVHFRADPLDARVRVLEQFLVGRVLEVAADDDGALVAGDVVGDARSGVRRGAQGERPGDGGEEPGEGPAGGGGEHATTLV